MIYSLRSAPYVRSMNSFLSFLSNLVPGYMSMSSNNNLLEITTSQTLDDIQLDTIQSSILNYKDPDKFYNLVSTEQFALNSNTTTSEFPTVVQYLIYQMKLDTTYVMNSCKLLLVVVAEDLKTLANTVNPTGIATVRINNVSSNTTIIPQTTVNLAPAITYFKQQYLLNPNLSSSSFSMSIQLYNLGSTFGSTAFQMGFLSGTSNPLLSVGYASIQYLFYNIE